MPSPLVHRVFIFPVNVRKYQRYDAARDDPAAEVDANSASSPEADELFQCLVDTWGARRDLLAFERVRDPRQAHTAHSIWRFLTRDDIAAVTSRHSGGQDMRQYSVTFMSAAAPVRVYMNLDNWLHSGATDMVRDKFALVFGGPEPGLRGYRKYVAAHEMGHVLGLQHLTRSEALSMARRNKPPVCNLMQQQSVEFEHDCTPNFVPSDGEYKKIRNPAHRGPALK